MFLNEYNSKYFSFKPLLQNIMESSPESSDGDSQDYTSNEGEEDYDRSVFIYIHVNTYV